MKLKIQRATFKNEEFCFLRNQRQDEADFGETIKSGVIYVHSWGTGCQELIFEDIEAANKWWLANCKRLTKRP